MSAVSRSVAAIPVRTSVGTWRAITNLLSGALIPLAFFPNGVGAALRWLPFAGITDTPARLYLGQLTGAHATLAVALEVAWTVVLLALGRGIWRAATREVTIHGG